MDDRLVYTAPLVLCAELVVLRLQTDWQILVANVSALPEHCDRKVGFSIDEIR